MTLETKMLAAAHNIRKKLEDDDFDVEFIEQFTEVCGGCDYGHMIDDIHMEIHDDRGTIIDLSHFCYNAREE